MRKTTSNYFLLPCTIRGILSGLLLVFLYGCGEEVDRAKDGTYLGGEIINPISTTLVLRKEGQVVAHINLNQNNRFLHKIKNLVPGLYEIFHGERQLIFIEPGDSLILRVNTMEFDESISFSGFGAERNNYLLKLFLKNEAENHFMLQKGVYQFTPEQFVATVDSLRRDRFKDWGDFVQKYAVSGAFKDLAVSISDYDTYSRKEVYPLTHFGTNGGKFLKALPEDFYAHRNKVNFNQGDHLPLYNYQRFLINYFNNMAFREYADTEGYDPRSFVHNMNELRLIDQTIGQDSIKSYLLTRTIKSYLANSNDKNGGATLYDIYMERVPSESDKNEIKELYTANKNIESGKLIPEEMLVDTKGEPTSLRQQIKGKSVIFLWSSEHRGHAIRAHDKARALSIKYPGFQFIGINIDQDTASWQKAIEKNGFDPKWEFRFADTYAEIKKGLAINSIAKTFLVKGDGTIVNAHTHLFSSSLEGELAKLVVEGQ